MSIKLKKNELKILLQQNKMVEANKLSTELCRILPKNIDIWLMSASINASLGNMDRVIECCHYVIKLQPDHLLAHYNLGLAYHTLGDFSSAEIFFNATLKLDPNMYKARVALGYAMIALGRPEEAIKLYHELLSGSAIKHLDIALSANINLSLALNAKRCFVEAEQACRLALAIEPKSIEALNNLGEALKEQGKLNDAVDAFRTAVSINPDFSVAHSNYLLNVNYLTDIDLNQVYLEYVKWGESHAVSYAAGKHKHSDCGSDSEKRLRIGYVSPDFRAHSVILFIAGVVESHNRENVEVFCYSDVKLPDAYTQKISETSDHWRETSQLSHEQLALLIAKDRIDILVDLTGHTANNRLMTFARKPAPIQVTWLGYPNTTGLKAIDYRFTDRWADPPGMSDQLNTETLIRISNGFLCYAPISDSPPISDLPMTESGFITFASFNNSSKINVDVIKLWSSILSGVKGSKLILKSPQFTDPVIKQRYLALFESNGIDSSRIEIYGYIASTIEHLAIYQKVDVGLDPFPYNGTTTTCEALWMGIPVVVLTGNSHVSRVGVSLLSNVGLTEFVAETKDEYIRICSNLAKSPEKLLEIRKGMRSRMENSSLLDIDGFVSDIESEYRNMWRTFCKS